MESFKTTPIKYKFRLDTPKLKSEGLPSKETIMFSRYIRPKEEEILEGIVPVEIMETMNHSFSRTEQLNHLHEIYHHYDLIQQYSRFLESSNPLVPPKLLKSAEEIIQDNNQSPVTASSDFIDFASSPKETQQISQYIATKNFNKLWKSWKEEGGGWGEEGEILWIEKGGWIEKESKERDEIIGEE